jgi:hypothetical protein
MSEKAFFLRERRFDRFMGVDETVNYKEPNQQVHNDLN